MPGKRTRAPAGGAAAAAAASKKVKDTAGDEPTVLRPTPSEVFARLIAPITVEQFFSDYWEKKPLVIRRGDPSYFRDLFSRDIMDKALRTRKLFYEEAINVVKYADGRRVSMNGTGRAKAEDVWRMFDKSGCTLQVRHPQHYSDEIYELLHSLEAFFGCLVGANVYATPPRAQGLAPHWDDIEAFVLQVYSACSTFVFCCFVTRPLCTLAVQRPSPVSVHALSLLSLVLLCSRDTIFSIPVVVIAPQVDGEKHWRLYAPQQPLSHRYSSDLDAQQLPPPLEDVVLRQGDTMYAFFFCSFLLSLSCCSVVSVTQP
jgi:hypothetical protein